jgi:hypothetical protein
MSIWAEALWVASVDIETTATAVQNRNFAFME